MVRDEARNAAYDAALRRAVTPGMRVLEIGTGSGLLAMMAARAGARHVYTCEVVPQIAQAAREIVARNGYAERITVLDKHSNAIAPDEIGGPADLHHPPGTTAQIVGVDHQIRVRLDRASCRIHKQFPSAPAVRTSS